MPCAGTLALIVPLLAVVAPLKASTREYDDDPLLPMAAPVVEIVRVALLWLNRATATSPLDSRLASTRHHQQTNPAEPDVITPA